MSKILTKSAGVYVPLALLIAGLALFGIAPAASANHSWGGYHWARTANPFTLKVADNVGTNWDAYLNTTIADWSVSNVVDMVKVPGTVSPQTCKATLGQVNVCNARYGNNGWLGIASIWANGTHITQGTVKLNDTYFNTAKYNTPAWRNLVSCQEVGHTLGLDHQDENFTNVNLNTCMDYTNNPESNQHPNAHDYEELDLIYAHIDSFTTLAAKLVSSPARNNTDITEDSTTWGKEIRTSADGHASVFEKDFGNGNKVITHVFWAEDHKRSSH